MAIEGPAIAANGQAAGIEKDEWIDVQDKLRMRELTVGNVQGPLGFALRKISMPMLKRKLLRLKRANPDLAEIYDFKIADLRQWRSSIASPEENTDARKGVEVALGRVEAQFGNSPYLVGAHYSLADLAWTCIFARLKMLGLADSFWGSSQLPRVVAYYEQLRSRPSFEKAGVWDRTPTPEIRRALLKSMLRGSGEMSVEALCVPLGSPQAHPSVSPAL